MCENYVKIISEMLKQMCYHNLKREYSITLATFSSTICKTSQHLQDVDITQIFHIFSSTYYYLSKSKCFL